MRVEHIFARNFTHDGATYTRPMWRVEGLSFYYHEPTVKVFLFVHDEDGKMQLIDIDLELDSLTESNVILAIEAWLDERAS
jgi:hypothetical protein